MSMKDLLKMNHQQKNKYHQFAFLKEIYRI